MQAAAEWLAGPDGAHLQACQEVGRLGRLARPRSTFERHEERRSAADLSGAVGRRRPSAHSPRAPPSPRARGNPEPWPRRGGSDWPLPPRVRAARGRFSGRGITTRRTRVEAGSWSASGGSVPAGRLQDTPRDSDAPAAVSESTASFDLWEAGAANYAGPIPSRNCFSLARTERSRSGLG